MIYKFKNVNPLNQRTLDCVCRAISLAMDKDYYEVENDINLVGQLFKCEKLCVCCYKYLLDYVYGLQRIEEVKGLTVYDFAHLYREGVYIVRVPNHVTTVIDGYCFDTWDCTSEVIDIVWQVK